MSTTKIFITSLLGTLAGGLILLAILALVLPRTMSRMMENKMRQMGESGCCSPDS